MEFVGSNVANDVYTTLSNWSTCARNGKLSKLKRELQVGTASGHLEFVAINIFGPLPHIVNGNQYVIEMTNGYSKLTRTMPTGTTSSSHVANVLFDSQVAPYGIPAYVLTDNGVQFTCKLFARLCIMLGVNDQTTTAYHPQTNGQEEQYIRAIVTRLGHYFAESQKHSFKNLQPLSFAYNTKVHKSTNSIPFSPVLSRHPPEPTTVF